MSSIRKIAAGCWKKSVSGDIELHPFVTFETIRRITQLENAELSLDETHFPKHTDYEIEYEYRKDHDGISVFNQILERAGLQYEKKLHEQARPCSSGFILKKIYVSQR